MKATQKQCNKDAKVHFSEELVFLHALGGSHWKKWPVQSTQPAMQYCMFDPNRQPGPYLDIKIFL